MKVLAEHLDINPDKIDKVYNDFVEDNYDYYMDQSAFGELMKDYYLKESKGGVYLRFVKEKDNIKYTNKDDLLEFIALYLNADGQLSALHQETNIHDLDDAVEVARYMHRRIIMAGCAHYILSDIIKDIDKDLLELAKMTMKISSKIRNALSIFLLDQEQYFQLINEKNDLAEESLVLYQRLK